jgi:hypothetical protein
METLLQQLDELVHVCRDWPEEGLPLHEKTISGMSSLISLLGDRLQTWRLIPTPKGGLVLELHGTPVYQSIEFDPAMPPEQFEYRRFDYGRLTVTANIAMRRADQVLAMFELLQSWR